MNPELEMAEAQEEPRDRTKYIWLGVVAAFAVMVVALWLSQKPTSSVSMVRAKHILVAAKSNDPVEMRGALERAQELRRRILNGEDFAQLARDYSNDPASAPRGGDLGYATKGLYENAFENYVWNPRTKIGEVGEIVKTNQGYHIIVLLDRRLSDADRYDLDIEKKAKEVSGGAPGKAEESKPAGP